MVQDEGDVGNYNNNIRINDHFLMMLTLAPAGIKKE